MAMSRRFVHTVITLVSLTLTTGAGAQVLPLLNEFTGREFTGTVQVSWPVLFRNCTFRTDSVLLSRSYGSVLIGCNIECNNQALYLAESGSGIIMSDCNVTGCNEVVPALKSTPADRTYVTGLKVNGHECPVPDDQDVVIDPEGLGLADAIDALAGGVRTDSPFIMVMTSKAKQLSSGDKALLSVRGLTGDMFIGWHTPDTALTLRVGDNPMECVVSLNEPVDETRKAVVTAHTDYGLEAAVVIELLKE